MVQVDGHPSNQLQRINNQNTIKK